MSLGSRAVKGATLKMSCDMLRGFESHLRQILWSLSEIGYHVRL